MSQLQAFAGNLGALGDSQSVPGDSFSDPNDVTGELLFWGIAQAANLRNGAAFDQSVEDAEVVSRWLNLKTDATAHFDAATPATAAAIFDADGMAGPLPCLSFPLTTFQEMDLVRPDGKFTGNRMLLYLNMAFVLDGAQVNNNRVIVCRDSADADETTDDGAIVLMRNNSLGGVSAREGLFHNPGPTVVYDDVDVWEIEFDGADCNIRKGTGAVASFATDAPFNADEWRLGNSFAGSLYGVFDVNEMVIVLGHTSEDKTNLRAYFGTT